ncbi:hypothetical protein RhiirA4_473106 [Rhizophagus irregularis]|uniref:Uncharacterized protein n=1 Tax=Rhizophagus irregularis TaxID=588596 RepID=A0A2I1H636_9GLOM|nr:hypothetical protein RhiirA4_473106 [Rhizophagus irregularis]
MLPCGKEYPNINLGDLDLILQISLRIYRLLQVFNVRTEQLADYKKGSTICEEGKKFMKKVKLDIIKAYFNEVDENLKDFIADDDKM